MVKRGPFNVKILLIAIIALVFTGVSIQNSFAEIPEFISEVPQFSASTQSTNSTTQTAKVTINTDALQSEIINLTVFGKTLQITHEETIFRNSTDYTFIGSTPNLKNNVFITVFGDQARLEISLPGENYVLSPSTNNHEIRNFDNTAAIADNIEEGNANHNWLDIISTLPSVVPSTDTHTTVVIDVLVLYTKAAIDDVGATHIQLIANQGMDKANTAFKISDIPVELNLVKIDSVGPNDDELGGGDYQEDQEDPFYGDLERLITKGDGYMEYGIAVRDNVNADIGVLLNNYGSLSRFCGLSPFILGDQVNAFVAVNVSCSSEDLIGNVLAHEIGHMMGARHNPGSDETVVPFEFGHAFRDVETGNETIMIGVNCYYCTWLTIWSDPNMFINGTQYGDEEYRNNAKVLALTGAYIASFRGGEETNQLMDIPPIIQAPPNYTIEATAVNTPLTQADYNTASAYGGTYPNPIVTNDAPDTFPLGDTIITWTATDVANNTASDTQIITLQITKPSSPPQNVTISQIASNDTTLSWSTPATRGFDVNEYKILRSSANFTNIATVPASVTTFIDRDVLPNTDYQYKVIAVNSIGDSDASSTVDITTSPRTGFESHWINNVYIGDSTTLSCDNPNDYKMMWITPFPDNKKIPIDSDTFDVTFTEIGDYALKCNHKDGNELTYLEHYLTQTPTPTSGVFDLTVNPPAVRPGETVEISCVDPDGYIHDDMLLIVDSLFFTNSTSFTIPNDETKSELSIYCGHYSEDNIEIDDVFFNLKIIHP